MPDGRTQGPSAYEVPDVRPDASSRDVTRACRRRAAHGKQRLVRAFLGDDRSPRW